MILTANLKKNNIIVNIKAKSRWDLIEKMLDTAIKNKHVNEEDRDEIKNSLFDREKSMSTGIGKGVAIPHCTSSKVNDIIIVLATSKTGIDFDSIDSLPVRIAILLLVQKNKLTQHIKTLANIAKIMGNDELREEILEMESSDAILKIIKNFEKSPKK